MAMAMAPAKMTTTMRLELYSPIIPPFLANSKPSRIQSSSLSFSLNFRQQETKHVVVKAGGSGLYSAEQLELNAENVDKVLDDVRPYLIADGGNIDVVSVDNGAVLLKLQGACGSCPSSTTTMKMGVERVLKEKFGDAIKDISQVDDQSQDQATTVDSVNAHLDILRPAINNFGGSVQVLSVVGGDCVVKYVGPPTIGSGIQAAIKERFPDILNVHFSD